MALLAPDQIEAQAGATTDVDELPPARLAGLLIEKRRHAGLDLAQVSRRSGGRFAPSDLDLFERGVADLDPGTAAELVNLYRFDSADVVPQRNQLELDLDAQQIRVGGEALAFADDSLILTRYVELLRRLRNDPAERRMTLRDADLSVLSNSLTRDIDELRAELYELMGDADAEREGNWVKLVGALSAVVVAGTAAVGVGAVFIDGLDRTAAGSGEGTAPTAHTLEQVRAIDGSNAGAAGSAGSGLQVTLASVPLPQTVVAAPGTDRQAQILAAVPWDYGAALPGWTVEFDGSSTEWHGLTNSRTSTITLYDRGEMTPAQAAEILVHELGHAIDLEYLKDATRMQWLEMRGMPAVWWAESGQPDFAVGSGDFAEAVAAVLTGSPSDSGFGEFTPAQLAFVANLIPGYE